MTALYSKQVKRAAIFAILTALLLIIVKGFAWWQTGSVSILASITDSMLDLFASFINMLILRFALMPADRNHSFGHGKAESLAMLAQSAFISGSAVFLLLQSIHIGIGVTLFSIVITLLLVWYQRRVITQTDSPAIKADHLHYQTDLLMNVTILISLSLTLWDMIWADAVFAVFIALYILLSAAKMFVDAVQLLLDIALPEQEVSQIEEIVLSDLRVLGFHDLRTRRSGSVRFIQLHLELDDHLSFLEAHDITDSLERRLRQAFPLVDIVIHHEPTSVVQAESMNV